MYPSSLWDTHCVAAPPVHQGELAMLPLACITKAKARHWSAEGNEVLFLFQNMFKQQIIFSALSLVSTTGNHRVTVPATFTFSRSYQPLLQKIFQEKLSVALSSHHPFSETRSCNFCLCFYSPLPANVQIAVH